MNAGQSSFDRAAALLRSILSGGTAVLRADLVKRVTSEANCHDSTVTRAIQEAFDLGYIQKTPYQRTVKYRWIDNPVPRDTSPIIVRIIPAAKAPRVAGEHCGNAIAWGLHHCLRAYA